MEAYKQEFMDFMVESDVLKFGDFTLKSGRKSPFFMNAGAYVTGTQLMRLGEYYAKAIHETYGDDFDVLFGPAYKGIPISVVTAVAYAKLYGKEVRYCSTLFRDRSWLMLCALCYRTHVFNFLCVNHLKTPFAC